MASGAGELAKVSQGAQFMLELTVGDRVRSREDGVTGTVMRREHDFEHPRYVIE